MITDIGERRVRHKPGGIHRANRLAVLGRHRAVVGQNFVFTLSIDDESVRPQIEGV